MELKTQGMTSRKTSDRKSSGTPKGWDPPPQLSTELQSKIGAQLREMHDDIIQQGVPDRFVDLLSKLDAPKDRKR